MKGVLPLQLLFFQAQTPFINSTLAEPVIQLYGIQRYDFPLPVLYLSTLSKYPTGELL